MTKQVSELRHSHYDALGIDIDSTEEDVKRQFHSVVRTLHPDRNQADAETLQRFNEVQSAWRVLSDPTKRLQYDLQHFGRSSLSAEAVACGELQRLQREQARRDVENMRDLQQRVLERERLKRGLVVRSAWYGVLTLRPDRVQECMIARRRTIAIEDLQGPCIDVTVAVQCLVEQHSIILPGGAGQSKAELPGFYDPTPLDRTTELSLYVLYEFRGQLHEVTVGDRESLRMPLRQHAVNGELRGPFCDGNANLLAEFKAEPQLASGAGPKGLAKAVLGYQLHWFQMQTGLLSDELAPVARG